MDIHGQIIINYRVDKLSGRGISELQEPDLPLVVSKGRHSHRGANPAKPLRSHRPKPEFTAPPQFGLAGSTLVIVSMEVRELTALSTKGGQIKRFFGSHGVLFSGTGILRLPPRIGATCAVSGVGHAKIPDV